MGDRGFSDTFAAAAFPPRCRVLGVRLHAFTLGHALLLEQLGSPFDPFAETPRPAEHGDTALALWVLARPWSVAADRIDARRTRWQLRWLSGRLWWRSGGAADGLREFLRASTALPEVRVIPQEGATRATTPTVPLLLLSLMREWGFSKRDALDQPVTLAWWFHLALLELRDCVQFPTPEYRLAIAEAERQRQNPEELLAWVESERQRLGIPAPHRRAA